MASKSDKTEKATPQRRRKAREEGQIARSSEVPVFVGLAIGALVMRTFLPAGVGGFASQVRAVFANLDPTAVPTVQTGRDLLAAAGLLLAPFLGAAMLAGLAAGFAQTRFNLSAKAAKPQWKRINPKQGLQRFKPKMAAWELLRTGAKVMLLIVVAWEPMTRIAGRLGGALGIDAALRVVTEEAWTILLRGIVLAFVIAAADYTFQFRKQEQDLKMSKQDIKDEHKNSEGDPLMKGARRRKMQELSRNRMLSDVARADVVLVNPTDFAIALKYDPGDAAPKVLAKGADHLAARIRAEAARNGVPVHVDIPLCRALYRQVKVGDLIPTAMFDAIAVVLVWAYRRTGRGPTADAGRSGAGRPRHVATAGVAR